MGSFVSKTSPPPTLVASEAEDEDDDDDDATTSEDDDNGDASSSGTDEMSTWQKRGVVLDMRVVILRGRINIRPFC